MAAQSDSVSMKRPTYSSNCCILIDSHIPTLTPTLWGSVSFGHKLMERTLEEHQGIMGDRALSVSRLARRLDVSARTARRIIEAGELKAHRIGRQWRVFKPDLADYLGRQANRQVTAPGGAQ